MLLGRHLLYMYILVPKILVLQIILLFLSFYNINTMLLSHESKFTWPLSIASFLSRLSLLRGSKRYNLHFLLYLPSPLSPNFWPSPPPPRAFWSRTALIVACVIVDRGLFARPAGESFVTSLLTFCFISIRALVSYWAIKWSAVNNDRALKDKLCQNIWVQ